LLFGVPLAAAEPPAVPNVVFVLVDDMGYADLGCTGARDINTPHIDSLARDGVRFTDFYANAPVCTPTRAAFVTGRWQQRCGLEWALGYTALQQRRMGEAWVDEPDKLALGLPATEPSLARMLKAAGYTTGVFGKWHLGFRREFNPTRHGFDEFFGVLLGHADFYRYQYFDGTYHLYSNDQPTSAEGYLTDLITQRAVRFVERAGRQPFFLYVPYNAVHWPFQEPDRPEQKLSFENKHDGSRAIYGRMLERVDQGVGQILQALQRQGVADQTLVIFSSDNGGERFSDNAPLFHHKATLWEGGIRVPCLMRWPARLPKGQVTRQPAITMDLTATILAASGAQPPAGYSPDGIDLLPILEGRQPLQQRTFYWRLARPERRQKAVRHGSWKYLQDGDHELLFDLANDISERRDLAYRHPDVLARLRQLLADWEREMDATPRAFVVR
jgi:arylsulfatase A-like enzyme